MKPLCVFGVMKTIQGLKIADEMMTWLNPVYDMHVVKHDGLLFELPALRYMQHLCIKQNRPCLYIHNRGAVNTWKTTLPTRRMWEAEFGQHWRKYFDIVSGSDVPMVACPFADDGGITRYNGFVANPAAMAAVKIEQSDDRMTFERLFQHTSVQVIGTLVSSERTDIENIRNYLYTHYL